MPASDDRIQGKVAAILSTRELALNVGNDDGVEIGTRFVILNSDATEVTDPDTGEPLGALPVPKTVVKVVRVDGPHLSVARTFRTIPAKRGMFGPTINLGGTPARTETLDVDTTMKSELGPAGKVRRGDLAVQTEGDEYDDL